MTIRVVHCQREDYDLYIGRAMPRYKLKASLLANPYQGATAVEAFRQHFTSKPSLQRYVEEMYEAHRLAQKVMGRTGAAAAPFTLGCWCKTAETPLVPCHGDVIRDYLLGKFHEAAS